MEASPGLIISINKCNRKIKTSSKQKLKIWHDREVEDILCPAVKLLKIQNKIQLLAANS